MKFTIKANWPLVIAILYLVGFLIFTIHLRNETVRELMGDVSTLETQVSQYRTTLKDYNQAIITVSGELAEAQKLPTLVIVTKVVEKEVIVEKVVYPQRFTDAEMAKEWVLSHEMPITLVADSSGRVDFSNPKSSSIYDCDDYADDYEAMALSENITLWQAPVTNGKIWGVKVSPLGRDNHVGLWTKIGNTYYYVEPQPLKDTWRFVRIMEAD